eukprot:TRINITY_DN2505_c0_g1_i1.p1 TRINITY_DN2505_c0_g1~~TRINITY_DN2505_c0_g1_i1.p1  ORF type:complete len:340 (+),score=70.49 TRINITY_DN2505_c0_g1_i1:387-1406(+)
MFLIVYAVMSYYLAILLFFYVVAVFDYFRRAKLMQAMGKMISTKTKIRRKIVKDSSGRARKVSEIAVSEPLIDVFNANNLFVWALSRRVIDDFGLRYRRRIEGYMSASVILTLGLAALLIISLLFNFDSLLMSWLCGSMMTILVVILGIVICFGFVANEQAPTHIDALLKVQLQARNALLRRTVMDTRSSHAETASNLQRHSLRFSVSSRAQAAAPQSSIHPQFAIDFSSSESLDVEDLSDGDDVSLSESSGSLNESLTELVPGAVDETVSLPWVSTAQLSAVNEMSECAIQMIVSQDSVNPIQIWGIKATRGLLKSLAAVALSTIALIFRILYPSQNI